MDTTKAELNLGTDAPTLAEDSRTVAEPAGSVASKPSTSAEIRDHELIRRIGQGSYGEVWLARNVMGTYRAVKIVYRAAFEHARPFEREFNGIQKFEPLSRSHDGFVDILQIGRADDYFYYVMELADDVTAGQQIDPNRYEPKTLRSEVQSSTDEAKKALPFEQCVELGLSLTQALGRLHEHGLIHRDIKPSNIIFVNGLPKLADIGLVAEQSEAKSFVGTEGFIPPEGPGTPQADIYSLGKVLYEIATGKDRHEFPALPTLLGDTTTDTHLLELNTVFLKACQSELKLRYHSAGQMRGDLLLLQSGKSVKHAQTVERRLTVLTRISFLGVALTVLAFLGIYFIKQQASREAAFRSRAESGERAARENLVRQFVANGSRLAEQGDLFGALPWFVKAVEEEPDLKRAELHRVRIGTIFKLAPKLTQMWFHDGPVNDVKFGPDGRFVASASDDKTARIWNTETGEPVTPPLAHEWPVLKAAFSPDGQRLITAAGREPIHWGTQTEGGGGEAKLWDARDGKLIATITHSNLVAVAVFSPDGRWFLTASHDGTAKVCDAKTGELVRVLKHAKAIFCIQFSADSQRVATGGEDSQARVWKVGSGEVLAECLHTGFVSDVQFSSDGRSLLSASVDGSARLWDAQTGQLLRLMGSGTLANTLSARLSPDGFRIVVASGDYRVNIWDRWSGQRLLTLPYAIQADYSQYPFFADFSPDSRYVLTVCEDRTVRLWDALSGRLCFAPLRHQGPVLAAAFGPEARRVVTASTDGAVKLWDLATDHSLDPVFRSRNGVNWARWSPDGRSVATMNSDGVTEVWDVATNRRIAAMPHGLQGEGTGGASGEGWSRDGGRFVTAAGDGQFRVWDAKTWQPLTPFMNVLTNKQINASLNPDGERVVVSGDTAIIRVFDATTGREVPLAPMSHDLRMDARYTADGRFIISGSFDGALKIWNATNGVLVSAPMRHEREVIWFQEDTNRQVLVSASIDGTARIWKIPSGEPITPPLRHFGAVGFASFSRDGEKLITSGLDRSACVWDAHTGAKLLTLEHEGSVNQACFSPDGRWIGTSSALGARLWDAETGEPLTSWLQPEGGGKSIGAFEFHPTNDRFLTVANGGADTSVWDLLPDDRTLEELKGVSALLAGTAAPDAARTRQMPGALNPSAVIGPQKTLASSDSSVRGLWQKMAATRTAALSSDAERALRWHRAQAEQCAFNNNPFPLGVHARSVLAVRPDDGQARTQLAHSLLGIGRAMEARALDANVLPARPKDARPQQINLDSYYMLTLVDDIGPGSRDGTLKEFPPGLHRLGGVDFDVRGEIALSGHFPLHIGMLLRTNVAGIQIAQDARRLHFLHATLWEAPDGTEIGHYVLHYRDGESRVLPILYGRDVRNWWQGGISDAKIEASEAEIVWRGQWDLARRQGASIRLYKRTYVNPRPDVEIVTLDVESTMSPCGLVLLAITVE